MIVTLEQAIKHSIHVNFKKFVIVLPDGNIYNTNSEETARWVLKENESAFIVKGQISKPVKEKKNTKE